MIAPRYVVLNMTAARPTMEKPLYQIPQKRICCALTVDSAGWKKLQREGSDNLKNVTLAHIFYYNKKEFEKS